MKHMKNWLSVVVALVMIVSCFVNISNAKADGVEDFVTRCYQKILGRNPDPGGLADWTQQLRSGKKTASTIIEAFVNSNEFKNKHLSNSECIEILYNTMLGRASDANGKQYWLKYLESGKSLSYVINGFCGSNEFTKLCKQYGIQPGSVNVGSSSNATPTPAPTNSQNLEQIRAFVTRCYKLILGRDPDTGGLNDWTNQLATGKKTAATIIEAFVNSNEFKNKHLSDSDCVEILYKTMLGRASDAAGKQYWMRYLEAGNSLSFIINGFCGSNEFKKICSEYGITPGTVNVGTVKTPAPTAKPTPTPNAQNVEKIRAFVTRCYKVILGRSPDEGGLNDWTNQLASGKKTASEIINGFMTSNEFNNKHYSDSQKVEILYNAMLGRGSDIAGKLSWMAVLNGGNPIGVVINGFCGSTEFKNLCNSYGIKPGSVAVGATKPSVPVNNYTETVTTTETIAYDIEYQNDSTRYPEDGNKVLQKGVNGSKEVVYLVSYNSSGKVVSKTVKSEKITKNPVKEIVSVPSKGHKTETKEETKTEGVPFETEKRNDPNRLKGQPDQVIQEGKYGVKTYVYTVTYVDGKETGRTLKSESITTQPVTRIISVATGENTVTYETVTVDIPFETVYQDAPNWYEDEEEVMTEGQNGQKEVTYAVTKDLNGNEISRTVSSEKVIKNVVNKVICKGTFVPVITYSYVSVPDLPECDPDRRDAELDSACASWAMKMAKANRVFHSDLGYGESVGGWGSIESMVYGRNYTVISTHDGQTYNYTVTLGSHGGELLALGERWGAGCAKRKETQPDGSTITIFFACARSDH